MRKTWLLIIIQIVAVLFLHCSSFLSGQASKKGKIINVRRNDKIIGLYEKSYALLIGISEYRDSYWPELPSIPREMTILKSALRKQGFETETLLNCSSATLKDKIEDFISWKGINENNRLLLFFSGHGYKRKSGNKGYIVPSDAPDPEKNLNGFIKKAVETSQILAWARLIESKHALFIFDSCYSGTIFYAKSASQTPIPITEFTGKPVRQFITAGTKDQRIPAVSNLVPYFARGIAGAADYTKDGYITASELGVYLQGQIKALNTRQIPLYGKIKDPELDQGDFVFILKPGTINPDSLKKTIVQGRGFKSLGDQITESKGAMLKVNDAFNYSHDKRYWLCFLDDERIWPMQEIKESGFDKNISIPTAEFHGGQLVLAAVNLEENTTIDKWFKSGNIQPLAKPDNLTIILATTIILKTQPEEVYHE